MRKHEKILFFAAKQWKNETITFYHKYETIHQINTSTNIEKQYKTNHNQKPIRFTLESVKHKNTSMHKHKSKQSKSETKQKNTKTLGKVCKPNPQISSRRPHFLWGILLLKQFNFNANNVAFVAFLVWGLWNWFTAKPFFCGTKKHSKKSTFILLYKEHCERIDC